MRAARSRPPQLTAPVDREDKNGDGMGELPTTERARAGGEYGTAWVDAQRGAAIHGVAGRGESTLSGRLVRGGDQVSAGRDFESS
jgi:hypothetical protein